MRNRLVQFLLIVFSGPALGQCLDSAIDLPAGNWRDAEHRPKFGMMKRHSAKPNKITIHYTGMKKNGAQSITKKLRGLVGYSQTGIGGTKTQLWGDMPYNYYIDMNGKSAEGRDANYQPDTNTKYNPDRHITIVVEGNDKDDLSAAQKQKLFAMIKGLQNKYGIPTSAISTHKHYADTDCPGPEIEAAIQEYKKKEARFVPDPNACESTVPTVPAAQSKAPASQVKPANRSQPSKPESWPKPMMNPASGGSFDDDGKATH